MKNIENTNNLNIPNDILNKINEYQQPFNNLSNDVLKSIQKFNQQNKPLGDVGNISDIQIRKNELVNEAIKYANRNPDIIKSTIEKNYVERDLKQERFNELLFKKQNNSITDDEKKELASMYIDKLPKYKQEYNVQNWVSDVGENIKNIATNAFNFFKGGIALTTDALFKTNVYNQWFNTKNNTFTQNLSHYLYDEGQAVNVLFFALDLFNIAKRNRLKTLAKNNIEQNLDKVDKNINTILSSVENKASQNDINKINELKNKYNIQDLNKLSIDDKYNIIKDLNSFNFDSKVIKDRLNKINKTIDTDIKIIQSNKSNLYTAITDTIPLPTRFKSDIVLDKSTGKFKEKIKLTIDPLRAGFLTVPILHGISPTFDAFSTTLLQPVTTSLRYYYENYSNYLFDDAKKEFKDITGIDYEQLSDNDKEKFNQFVKTKYLTRGPYELIMKKDPNDLSTTEKISASIFNSILDAFGFSSAIKGTDLTINKIANSNITIKTPDVIQKFNELLDKQNFITKYNDEDLYSYISRLKNGPYDDIKKVVKNIEKKSTQLNYKTFEEILVNKISTIKEDIQKQLDNLSETENIKEPTFREIMYMVRQVPKLEAQLKEKLNLLSEYTSPEIRNSILNKIEESKTLLQQNKISEAAYKINEALSDVSDLDRYIHGHTEKPLKNIANKLNIINSYFSKLRESNNYFLNIQTQLLKNIFSTSDYSFLSSMLDDNYKYINDYIRNELPIKINEAVKLTDTLNSTLQIYKNIVDIFNSPTGYVYNIKNELKKSITDAFGDKLDKQQIDNLLNVVGKKLTLNITDLYLSLPRVPIIKDIITKLFGELKVDNRLKLDFENKLKISNDVFTSELDKYLDERFNMIYKNEIKKYNALKNEFVEIKKQLSDLYERQFDENIYENVYTINKYSQNISSVFKDIIDEIKTLERNIIKDNYILMNLENKLDELNVNKNIDIETKNKISNIKKSIDDVRNIISEQEEILKNKIDEFKSKIKITSNDIDENINQSIIDTAENINKLNDNNNIVNNNLSTIDNIINRINEFSKNVKEINDSIEVLRYKIQNKKILEDDIEEVFEFADMLDKEDYFKEKYLNDKNELDLVEAFDKFIKSQEQIEKNISKFNENLFKHSVNLNFNKLKSVNSFDFTIQYFLDYLKSIDNKYIKEGKQLPKKFYINGKNPLNATFTDFIYDIQKYVDNKIKKDKTTTYADTLISYFENKFHIKDIDSLYNFKHGDNSLYDLFRVFSNKITKVSPIYNISYTLNIEIKKPSNNFINKAISKINLSISEIKADTKSKDFNKKLSDLIELRNKFEQIKNLSKKELNEYNLPKILNLFNDVIKISNQNNIFKKEISFDDFISIEIKDGITLKEKTTKDNIVNKIPNIKEYFLSLSKQDDEFRKTFKYNENNKYVLSNHQKIIEGQNYTPTPFILEKYYKTLFKDKILNSEIPIIKYGDFEVNLTVKDLSNNNEIKNNFYISSDTIVQYDIFKEVNKINKIHQNIIIGNDVADKRYIDSDDIFYNKIIKYIKDDLSSKGIYDIGYTNDKADKILVYIDDNNVKDTTPYDFFYKNTINSQIESNTDAKKLAKRLSKMSNQNFSIDETELEKNYFSKINKYVNDNEKSKLVILKIKTYQNNVNDSGIQQHEQADGTNYISTRLLNEYKRILQLPEKQVEIKGNNIITDENNNVIAITKGLSVIADENSLKVLLSEKYSNLKEVLKNIIKDKLNNKEVVNYYKSVYKRIPTPDDLVEMYEKNPKLLVNDNENIRYYDFIDDQNSFKSISKNIDGYKFTILPKNSYFLRKKYVIDYNYETTLSSQILNNITYTRDIEKNKIVKEYQTFLDNLNKKSIEKFKNFINKISENPDKFLFELYNNYHLNPKSISQGQFGLFMSTGMPLSNFIINDVSYILSNIYHDYVVRTKMKGHSLNIRGMLNEDEISEYIKSKYKLSDKQIKEGYIIVSDSIYNNIPDELKTVNEDGNIKNEYKQVLALRNPMFHSASSKIVYVFKSSDFKDFGIIQGHHTISYANKSLIFRYLNGDSDGDTLQIITDGELYKKDGKIDKDNIVFKYYDVISELNDNKETFTYPEFLFSDEFHTEKQNQQKIFDNFYDNFYYALNNIVLSKVFTAITQQNSKKYKMLSDMIAFNNTDNNYYKSFRFMSTMKQNAVDGKFQNSEEIVDLFNNVISLSTNNIFKYNIYFDNIFNDFNNLYNEFVNKYTIKNIENKKINKNYLSNIINKYLSYIDIILNIKDIFETVFKVKSSKETIVEDNNTIEKFTFKFDNDYIKYIDDYLYNRISISLNSLYKDFEKLNDFRKNIDNYLSEKDIFSKENIKEIKKIFIDSYSQSFKTKQQIIEINKFLNMIFNDSINKFFEYQNPSVFEKKHNRYKTIVDFELKNIDDNKQFIVNYITFSNIISRLSKIDEIKSSDKTINDILNKNSIKQDLTNILNINKNRDFNNIFENIDSNFILNFNKHDNQYIEVIDKIRNINDSNFSNNIFYNLNKRLNELSDDIKKTKVGNYLHKLTSQIDNNKDYERIIFDEENYTMFKEIIKNVNVNHSNSFGKYFILDDKKFYTLVEDNTVDIKNKFYKKVESLKKYFNDVTDEYYNYKLNDINNSEVKNKDKLLNKLNEDITNIKTIINGILDKNISQYINDKNKNVKSANYLFTIIMNDLYNNIRDEDFIRFTSNDYIQYVLRNYFGNLYQININKIPLDKQLFLISKVSNTYLYSILRNKIINDISSIISNNNNNYSIDIIKQATNDLIKDMENKIYNNENDISLNFYEELNKYFTNIKNNLEQQRKNEINVIKDLSDVINDDDHRVGLSYNIKNISDLVNSNLDNTLSNDHIIQYSRHLFNVILDNKTDTLIHHLNNILNNNIISDNKIHTEQFNKTNLYVKKLENKIQNIREQLLNKEAQIRILKSLIDLQNDIKLNNNIYTNKENFDDRLKTTAKEIQFSIADFLSNTINNNLSYIFDKTNENIINDIKNYRNKIRQIFIKNYENDFMYDTVNEIISEYTKLYKSINVGLSVGRYISETLQNYITYYSEYIKNLFSLDLINNIKELKNKYKDLIKPNNLDIKIFNDYQDKVLKKDTYTIFGKILEKINEQFTPLTNKVNDIITHGINNIGGVYNIANKFYQMEFYKLLYEDFAKNRLENKKFIFEQPKTLEEKILRNNYINKLSRLSEIRTRKMFFDYTYNPLFVQKLENYIPFSNFLYSGLRLIKENPFIIGFLSNVMININNQFGDDNVYLNEEDELVYSGKSLRTSLLPYLGGGSYQLNLQRLLQISPGNINIGSSPLLSMIINGTGDFRIKRYVEGDANIGETLASIVSPSLSKLFGFTKGELSTPDLIDAASYYLFGYNLKNTTQKALMGLWIKGKYDEMLRYNQDELNEFFENKMFKKLNITPDILHALSELQKAKIIESPYKQNKEKLSLVYSIMKQLSSDEYNDENQAKITSYAIANFVDYIFGSSAFDAYNANEFEQFVEKLSSLKNVKGVEHLNKIFGRFGDILDYYINNGKFEIEMARLKAVPKYYKDVNYNPEKAREATARLLAMKFRFKGDDGMNFDIKTQKILNGELHEMLLDDNGVPIVTDEYNKSLNNKMFFVSMYDYYTRNIQAYKNLSSLYYNIYYYYKERNKLDNDNEIRALQQYYVNLAEKFKKKSIEEENKFLNSIYDDDIYLYVFAYKQKQQQYKKQLPDIVNEIKNNRTDVYYRQKEKRINNLINKLNNLKKEEINIINKFSNNKFYGLDKSLKFEYNDNFLTEEQQFLVNKFK